MLSHSPTFDTGMDNFEIIFIKTKQWIRVERQESITKNEFEKREITKTESNLIKSRINI